MSGRIIDLEKEFANFLEEFGAEISDKTLTGPNVPTNADYIFHDDKVIAELKRLNNNPFEDKNFKKSFEKKQREWLQKGYATLDQLDRATNITQLPEKCYNDILKLYSRPIKNHIDKANDQIKKTKIRLNLPDYKGLLFLASDGNYFIKPRHVRALVADLLKNPSKNRSINTVIYFTANVVTVRPNDPTFTRLWVQLYRDKEFFENVSLQFLKKLYNGWVSYYSNIIGIDLKNISELNEEGLTETDMLTDAEFIMPEEKLCSR